MLKFLDPRQCIPPHKVTHPEKLAELTHSFHTIGYDMKRPFLVGYPMGGKVQLLSGSHRWAAAMTAQILIPVLIHSLEDVEAAWGDVGRWEALMGSAG